MTLSGIDISSHQGAPNFDALAHSTDFVISKATEGIDYLNPQFGRDWAETKRVGLGRGVYHFAKPDLGNSAIDEAVWFLAHVGLEDGDVPALDYEVEYDDPVGWCLAFLEEVRADTGVRPLLYLNLSLVRNHDWRPVIDAGYGLWLADYDGSPTALPSTPWPFVAMKQWTSSGAVDGVGGLVDVNTFFGTREQFDAYGRKQMAHELMAQNADLILRPGETSTPMQATYTYPELGHPGGIAVPQRGIKVKGTKLGRHVLTIRPPVDPFADETLDLDAEPALIVIDVMR